MLLVCVLVDFVEGCRLLRLLVLLVNCVLFDFVDLLCISLLDCFAVCYLLVELLWVFWTL